jgi:hypothetical protein
MPCKRIPWLVAIAFVPVGWVGTEAQVPVEQQFAQLLALLPEDARDGAELLIPDGDGFEVYRRGENQFVCVADAPEDARYALTCYHKSLGEFLAWERKLSAAGFRGAAYRTQLCRDVEVGNVSVPDRAYSLTVSGAIPEGHDRPDSLTVYHFIQLPYATEESAGITDEEPAPGQPWLHQGGTCNAHLMWSRTLRFAPGH